MSYTAALKINKYDELFGNFDLYINIYFQYALR